MEKLIFLLPEITLIILSIALLANSIIDLGHKRFLNKSMLFVGTSISIIFLINQIPDGLHLNATLENNQYTKIIKIILVLASMFSLLIVSNSKTDELRKYFNEYCFLIILSLVGAMLVVSSREFFTLIISFELLSIPLYLISGMGTNSKKSIEAATKFFFFGSLSTVCLIFSAVLFYAIAGTTSFVDIDWGSNDFILVTASIFLLIAVSFKCALYPFQFWVSDVYESAPMNMLPFLSTIPKISIIGFLIFFFNALTSNSLNHHILIIIAIISIASILVGSLLAIKQNNLLRLLAYSGIPHAGMMLIGIMSTNNISGDILILYFTFYTVANVGLYVCINSLPNSEEYLDIDNLSGLYKNNTFLAICISCFMLSLAGAPLFAGFWAKFNIILISYKSFGLILPAFILIGTLISFYYYLKVIKIIFSERQLDQKENINFSFINKAIIIVCAIVTIILGVYPNILQNII
tara:strand:+ start:120 stop:1514 length:1395 start_codon:yes stop_codon:yes gene_type:complete